MVKYYVTIDYQYYNSNNKPGRRFNISRVYMTKNKALDFVKRVKKEKTEEFKQYNGKLKKFKYKIKWQ